MEILDIGSGELLLILVLAFVLIGPYKAEEVGKTLGRWLNRLFKSEGWQLIRDFSTGIVNLPAKLAREANMDELEKQLDIDPSMINAAPRVITASEDKADEGHSIMPSRSQAYSPHPPVKPDDGINSKTTSTTKRTSTASRKKKKSSTVTSKAREKKKPSHA